MKYDFNDITVIILAGGQGTRFEKRNKGLLKINNETFVSHLLKKLLTQSKIQIISANNNIEEYEYYNTQVIKDRVTNYQGPLSGIISCKSHIKTPLVLTIPCDSPIIPDDLSQRLLETYNNNEETQLCVVDDGERLQNLFMLFNVTLLDNMETYFLNNQRSVHGWLKNQKYKTVDFSDKAINFTNVNDQSNLDDLLAVFSQVKAHK